VAKIRAVDRTVADGSVIATKPNPTRKKIWSPMENSNSNNKLFGLLSYILAPLVGAIVMLTDMKNDAWLKRHAVQSIAIGVIGIILGFVGSFLLCIPNIILLVMQIIWGVNAYQGKEVTIPVITDFCKNQGWI
jgi:uncharacterized membrane protein